MPLYGSADHYSRITTAYIVLAHMVERMPAEARLRRMVIDDTKIEAIRGTIVERVSTRLQNFWTHDGEGVWTKSIKSTPGLGEPLAA